MNLQLSTVCSPTWKAISLKTVVTVFLTHTFSPSLLGRFCNTLFIMTCEGLHEVCIRYPSCLLEGTIWMLQLTFRLQSCNQRFCIVTINLKSCKEYKARHSALNIYIPTKLIGRNFNTKYDSIRRSNF